MPIIDVSLRTESSHDKRSPVGSRLPGSFHWCPQGWQEIYLRGIHYLRLELGYDRVPFGDAACPPNLADGTFGVTLA